MADEQRLKDATITLRLDLSDAQRDLPDGTKKKTPGRKDDDKRREDEAREERTKPRTGRKVGPGGVAVGVAAARGKLASKVVGLLKVAALVQVNTFLADRVAGAIEKRLAQLSSDETTKRKILEGARIANVPAQLIAAGQRKASQIATFLSTFAGTFKDMAFAQQVLFGESDASDASEVARLHARVAVAQKFFEQRRARIVGHIKGGVFVDLGDALKKAGADYINTSR